MLLMVLCSFGFAAILDIKGRDIPLIIWIFPTMVGIISLLFRWSDGDMQGFSMKILSAIALFVLGIGLCLFFGMGGADALMMFSLGIVFGMAGILMVATGFLSAIPHCIYFTQKKRKGEEAFFPLLPYLLVGTVIWCLFAVWKRTPILL